MRQLSYLSTAGASRLAEIETARAAYRETMDEIHSIPDFAALSDAPCLGDVDQALGADSLSAYILTTEHGTLTLVAGGRRVDKLWFHHLTERDVGALNYGERLAQQHNGTFKVKREEMGGWFGAYWSWRSALEAADKSGVEVALRAWQEQIDRTIRSISSLMSPLAEEMRRRDRTRLVLVPLMTLSWWPLHAAWSSGESAEAFLLDGVAVSYAPSVTTCHALAETERGGASRSILAIGSPENADRAALSNAAAEAELVVENFAEKRLLVGADATVEAFVAAASSADIWHFAGHAIFGWGETVHEGALAFAHGELLRLNEIRRLDVGSPKLVVLSACESGMFNIALANERQSLATAILELGARNVIATLWPVDDRASLLFMASFYDALRGAAPADALRLAQHWMRSTTDGQKKTWVRDRLASHEKGSRVREGLIGLYRDLALRDQQERHYAQAYYWAGYQLHGLQTGWI